MVLLNILDCTNFYKKRFVLFNMDGVNTLVEFIDVPVSENVPIRNISSIPLSERLNYCVNSDESHCNGNCGVCGLFEMENFYVDYSVN